MQQTNNQYIKVKRLSHAKDLDIPRKMSDGASGCDIRAAIQDPVTLVPGKRALIPTGFAFEIPEGYEVQVRSRSGLAIKHGIMALNSPGTIDADYRGEVKVILANLGDEPFTIKRGDRIAQLVVMAVPLHMQYVESEELTDTARGEGGFGSSGI